MTGNRKRKRRKSARHVAIRRNGIVLTPVRLAVTALIEPRLNREWHWVCPSMSDTVVRLSAGRASKFIVRHWLNGTRRAPAWFVAVLRSELQRQVRHRQDIDAKLAEIETQCGDRRRGPIARARARAQMIAGIGAIGQSKRAQDAANEDRGGKNDPHN